MDPNDLINAAKGAAEIMSALPISAIVKRMLGPAVDELAYKLRDQVRLYRYERQVKLFEEAERMAQEAGLFPQAVPLELMFKFSEGKAPEENEGRTAGSALMVSAVAFSPELLRFLRENPDHLRILTPEQFEQFVADRLDQMGYEVRLTGKTNRKDGGIDLIAFPKLPDTGSVLIGGQIKHHRQNHKTGRESVDRLLAWKDSAFRVGLLITNTSFTKDATWAAERDPNKNFIRLRDFNDMKRWLDGRFADDKDWREIPDSIELAPGIVIEIPKIQSSSGQPPKPKS